MCGAFSKSTGRKHVFRSVCWHGEPVCTLKSPQSPPVYVEDRTSSSFTLWSDSCSIWESSDSVSLSLHVDSLLTRFCQRWLCASFPFDGKGELSALNVEPRNGKWVSYLFQTVDLSWVKWKSFMLGGRKRPKRGKKPVRLIFHSGLFNYFLYQSLCFFFILESQQAAKITFAFEAISVKKVNVQRWGSWSKWLHIKYAHKHSLLVFRFLLKE